MSVKNQAQLITYPDSLGKDLKELYTLLTTHFLDIFGGGIHILPPFPSSADRGFAPMTYFEIDPRFGNWDDIRRIGERFDLLLDVMVNHISRRSVYFQDFLKRGRRSGYADMFIPLDKIWPHGDPPPEDVEKIFLRKPVHPFSEVRIEETGEVETIWTSFGSEDWSEQIDFDVHSPITRDLLTRFLGHLSRQRVKILRLDAVGYVIKKPGTSCFFVEPEIYQFLEWIQGVADSVGIILLPEVHAHYTTQFKLADHGYWVYDFVLPMLILHALFNRSSRKLHDYLKICPRKQFTMLDCHDGIPVQPDVDDILEVEESKAIVDICLERGGNLNRLLTRQRAHQDLDAHQINCTYYSALDCDDDAYMAARAIQFFAPGVPQVYYVGLLAGENDHDRVRRTGEGRAINRHNYTVEEVERALQKPVVQRLMRLIRFRNTYPAFDGAFEVLSADDDQLRLSWRQGEAACRLEVDLTIPQAVITYRDDRGEMVEYAV